MGFTASYHTLRLRLSDVRHLFGMAGPEWGLRGLDRRIGGNGGKCLATVTSVTGLGATSRCDACQRIFQRIPDPVPPGCGSRVADARAGEWPLRAGDGRVAWRTVYRGEAAFTTSPRDFSEDLGDARDLDETDEREHAAHREPFGLSADALAAHLSDDAVAFLRPGVANGETTSGRADERALGECGNGGGWSWREVYRAEAGIPTSARTFLTNRGSRPGRPGGAMRRTHRSAYAAATCRGSPRAIR